MDWHHIVPFAALFSEEVAPANRPMLTRLTEQALVGVFAAGVTLYADNLVTQDKIANLTEQVSEVKTVVVQMQRDLYIPRSDESNPYRALPYKGR